MDVYRHSRCPGGGSRLSENIQLASCVELHPRIQGKENSCQTMNYCSVTRQHERHHSEPSQHGVNPAEFPTTTSTCSLYWSGLLKGLPALFGSAMQTAHIPRLTPVNRAGSGPRAGGSHGRLGVTHDREAQKPRGPAAHRRRLCLRHGVKRIVGIWI
ncbi:hypothetical protein EYF80_029197 [Liparis tanakae]|uniref:Uncharacterized protein n=1 Tax=Liparis tanakae TaxID=230148 RepID=A0A4Z2H469_9TELE|nr:hypothetical protein EYF80_029197 [Liparis tanakae]